MRTLIGHQGKLLLIAWPPPPLPPYSLPPTSFPSFLLPLPSYPSSPFPSPHPPPLLHLLPLLSPSLTRRSWLGQRRGSRPRGVKSRTSLCRYESIHFSKHLCCQEQPQHIKVSIFTCYREQLYEVDDAPALDDILKYQFSPGIPYSVKFSLCSQSMSYREY